jgi:hypothetical protein
MSLNTWYTVAAGDTLSKIAANFGIGDWHEIYNHEKNADFRKKRPDPDKIYPGDTIWIPGPDSERIKTTTGAKTTFQVTVEKLEVLEIAFDGQIDIYYVRFDQKSTDYSPENIPAGKTYLHINPPTVYPKLGDPHWKWDEASGKVAKNWPAVFVRDDAAKKHAFKRTLSVTLKKAVASDGELYVYAEGADFKVAEQKVTFAKGVAKSIKFEFSALPQKVGKYSQTAIQWYFRTEPAAEAQKGPETKHTIFIVDDKPKKANLRGYDYFLFEVCDWGCTWAQGKSGYRDVLAAIWSQFSPVKANHATGLIYWKDSMEKGVEPHQAMDLAIRSQDDPLAPDCNAASCVVFAHVLINCLSLHGIEAAEIRIELTADSKKDFIRNGRQYYGCRFNSKTTKAQGTLTAPPAWVNHWIVDVGDVMNQWNIFDPSYGIAPYLSSVPIYLNEVDVVKYEEAGVRDFECIDMVTAKPENLGRDPNPVELPHLQGTTLWRP